jgi:hypothetical protein
LFGPGDWPLMKPDKIKKPDAFRVKAKVTCAQAQKPLLVDAVPRDSDGNLYPKRLAGFIQMLGATTLG